MIAKFQSSRMNAWTWFVDFSLFECWSSGPTCKWIIVLQSTIFYSLYPLFLFLHLVQYILLIFQSHGWKKKWRYMRFWLTEKECNHKSKRQDDRHVFLHHFFRDFKTLKISDQKEKVYGDDDSIDSILTFDLKECWYYLFVSKALSFSWY